MADSVKCVIIGVDTNFLGNQLVDKNQFYMNNVVINQDL